jgi:hypothetical protein
LGHAGCFRLRHGTDGCIDAVMTDLASTTDLLRRAREGDSQALDDLIRRHQGP